MTTLEQLKKDLATEHKARCGLERRFDHRIANDEPAKLAYTLLGCAPANVDKAEALAALSAVYDYAQALAGELAERRRAEKPI